MTTPTVLPSVSLPDLFPLKHNSRPPPKPRTPLEENLSPALRLAIYSISPENLRSIVLEYCDRDEGKGMRDMFARRYLIKGNDVVR
jgi:hypothetical protein